MTNSNSSGVRAAGKSSACPSNPLQHVVARRISDSNTQFSLGLHSLTEVELGDLKKLGKEIAETLGERLKADVTLHGKTLIVPDLVEGKRLGVKDLKVQMKHVLHHLHLSEEYRVLAEHKSLKIVRVEEKTRHAEREGTAPPPAQSLPYFFPG